MARIQIEKPPVVHFTTEMEVRIYDINYGNHLGNDSILSMLHEARMRFFSSLGYSEMDFGGTSIIMSDSAIIYKSEGFYGHRIRIDVSVYDLGRSGFDLYYGLLNLTTGKELAIAKTGILCFDYKERKIKPVPAAFTERFSTP